MQSHSCNHFYPDPGHKVPGRILTNNVHASDKLSPETTRLWSFQEPTLLAGDYDIKVSQTIHLPASITGDTPPPENLTIPDKYLSVQAPKFSLSDPEDLHSVHPATGHSAPNRTLAHVVLSHPTVPWERAISASEGKAVGFNRLPWVGVLSFTEDELLMTEKQFGDIGFRVNDGGDQVSGLGAISTVAKRIDALGTKIASALTLAPSGDERDFDDEDKVSMLLLKPSLFKDLFSTYDANNKRTWNGKADLSRFAMLAHGLETHGGLTASSYAEKASSPQPTFSVVVSARTGPSNISQPTRVITHLISLDSLDRIDISKPATEYVGLVSLQAWDWMAMPEQAIDFAAVMSNLGESVGPLAPTYDDELMAPRDGEPAHPAEFVNWTKEKFQAGFLLKPHTTISGEKTESLLRGPLIPARSSTKLDGIDSPSLYGEGLECVDKDSGISVVSYNAAWALGRSMLMADRTLTASLLRLRGRVHAEVVRRVKWKSLKRGGDGGKMLFSNSSEDLLNSLDNVLHQLEKKQDIDGLWGTRSAANRWTRSEAESARLPARLLTSGSTAYTLTEYLDEVDLVVNGLFGFESKDETGKVTPPHIIDADAAAIRAWTLDRAMLAGIPLHSLILDSSMLPRESIRTFYVDHCWIDKLVDGGLSVANHFARDDDPIRRTIKECINKYLDTPTIHESNAGEKPQLPRWGFFLRSVAVSSCPDLKVEASLPEGTAPNTKEILYIQRLAPDILVYLFDRCPGDGKLKNIIMSQPPHQQGYELGTYLKPDKLEICHRGVPSAIEKSPSLAVTPFSAKDGALVYDFETRMVRPDSYMASYFTSVQGKGDTFKWQDLSKPPSSLLATQLWSTNLRLEFSVKDTSEPKDAADDHSSKPLRFSTGYRPDQRPNTAKTVPNQAPSTLTTPSRATPSKVALPTGPRRKVPQVGLHSIESIEENQEVSVQSLPPKSLEYQALPAQANCMPIYEPGNKTNHISAISSPTDLVFYLGFDDAAKTKVPEEVEVRIPIALSSNIYPNEVKDKGLHGLIKLEGTTTTAHVPTLEDTSVERHWTITGRIDVGYLYAIDTTNLPPEGRAITPQAHPTVLLILSIKPRFSQMPLEAFNVCFLLRNINFVLPLPDTSTPTGQLPSRKAQFDVWWHHKDEETISVRATSVTIRPAIITDIIIVTPTVISEGADISTMRLRLSPSPPSGSHLQVTVYKSSLHNGLSLAQKISKIPIPKSLADDSSVFEYSFATNFGRPLWITAGITDLIGPNYLGPESASYLLHRVVIAEELEVIFCWKEDKTYLFWNPPQRGDASFNVAVKTLTPNEIEYPSVPGSNGTCVLPPPSGLSNIGTPTEYCVIFNFQGRKSESYKYVHVSLPPPLPSIPFTARRQLPRSRYTGNSQFGVMRYPRRNANGLWDSELWYRSGPRSFTGIRVRRDKNSLTEGGLRREEPDIPQSFPDCAGALVSFYIISQDAETKTNGQFYVIMWIGSDGSINITYQRERDGFFEASTSVPGEWYTEKVCPEGSASTVGGGSIHVTYVIPVVAMVWWVGSEGQLCRGSFSTEQKVREGVRQTVYPAWLQPPEGGRGFTPAGSPYMSYSASMCTTIAALQVSPSVPVVFWNNNCEELMLTYYPDGPRDTLGSVVFSRPMRASSSTKLAASWHVIPRVGRAICVAWIGDDGAVYCSYTVIKEDEDIQNSDMRTLYRLTTAGAANPDADLRFFGKISEPSLGIVFIGVDGFINTVTGKCSDTKMDNINWSVLPTKGRQGRIGLHLAIVESASEDQSTKGHGISDIFFWNQENQLDHVGIDLSAS